MGAQVQKRCLAFLLVLTMLLQIPVIAGAAEAPAGHAPELRYYLQNDTWHYAEEIPLYHAVDAIFYLDTQDPSKVVLPAVQVQGTAGDQGILSQFDPSGSTAEGESLSYRSAALFSNYQNDLVGYPTADLHVTAAQAGTVTVQLEAVDDAGAVTLVAQGTAAVSAGEQSLEGIVLSRAYDDGQGAQPDFVAYRFPKGGSIRVSVTSDAGAVTLIQDQASKVVLPFVDHDENGYTGQVTVDGAQYPAVLYWLEENIYVSYDGQWLTIPANSPYTVNAAGAAVFDSFTFLPEGNAFKDAAEQNYTGGNTHTQPFPTYRHIVLDTVPIEPAADYLYLPTSKTLKYDIFMPTAKGEAPVPLLLYIHGYSGSYSALPEFLVDMLDEGYAVAGIDLRNYPSNYSPDYYHDIKGNIRDIRAKADQYGVDPERFGIYGVSLGGNTALMMAVSAGNAYMEGTVGGNEGVSSRLQAAICGYAWSDAINFGADQRTDNANDSELLASMISGGDGENAPCAQAIGFSGPGKGYLSLRLYKEAWEQAKANGTEAEFLSTDYTFTIDDDYIETWFPVLGENAFTGAAPTVTKGTYTFSHAYMQEKLTYAEAASPLYYISPDDPSIMLFGGYGGRQNITNTQSTRTLKRLSEMGVPAVMAGNTMGNYGNEAEVRASMQAYLDQTLMERPAGMRVALTLGAADAVVNDLDVPAENALIAQDGTLLIDLSFVDERFGTRHDAGAEGVSQVGGKDYGTTDYVKTLTGGTVTTYTGETYTGDAAKAGYTMVTIVKSGQSASGSAASEVTEPEKVSLPGQYEGYYDEEDLFEYTVSSSVYVKVPATYPDQVEYPSDPNYTDDPSYDSEDDTIKLALTYVLPSEDGVTPAEGSYPTVMAISRGGRAVDGGLHGTYLVQHGYAYVVVEMRGCGASFGVNNSFASLENRLDVKYIIENWLTQQAWSDGTVGTEGGSNKGLIQWATATTQPEGLLAIAPEVCNPDFYYQDYRNGVSACPGSGAHLSGSQVDTEIQDYETWIENPGVAFVDDDPEGRLAYEAYCYYTKKNMPFTTYLLEPNLNRDEPNESLYGEQVNLTIPPMEYSEELLESGVQIHQMGGWDDANAAYQIAAANAWGGKVIMGPWGHGSRGKEIEGVNNSFMDMAQENLRYFDAILKGMDNGYEDSPNFYYYVMNAPEGEEWRWSDTFPLDNTANSALYLAGEDSGEVLSDALKLDGPQSNNGKLSLVQPEETASDDYRVDLSIEIPGSSNLSYENYGEMQDAVDSKGLTFTSAPLAADAEIVGIPTADLWISSANADDVDLIVYLEEVKEDGTSIRITGGEIRASHRTTGPNDMWDSTEGLAGRFHTSLTRDVEAALEEGLEEPVLLQVNLEATGYRVSAGSSLRFTVTCADTKTYQHEPYYALDEDGNPIVDEETGAYVMKSEEELPVIELYRGGDKASFINIPVVENVSNTFNGTVTFADGSYTGPGTMYLFDANWYLYANGDWTKLSVESGENAYTVEDGAAVFEAGFTFLPEGSRVIKNGIAQNYQGGQAHVQSFPTYYKLHVDTVANQTGNTNANMLLYLPATKSLDINLFLPEDAEGPVPVILYIHGFGGTNIDIDTNLLSLLDEGYALAGVDLRNYPPNENPLYYQDIKGDIRYLRANAEELGLDPDRFGIYGVSLGGNTSLMMLLSGNDPFLEGDVGGNLHVSSRVQAGIAGYAWSDAINFGADQRSDYDYDFELMSSMISGGDGENAPCAQAIDFSGPGKGYLVLRNYLEARQEAEANGTLQEFLAEDYTIVIDQDYVDKWFPGQEASTNPFIGSGATVTLGTYTYQHEYLMEKVADAQKASPMYYASPDDPTIVVFGGFGGRQNITNQQSVRTESALQDNDVLAFYFGNSVVSWNDYSKYGAPASIQAGFKEYWDHYLKEGPSERKIVLTAGSNTAVVDRVDREIADVLTVVDGVPQIPASAINEWLGTDLTGRVTVETLEQVNGVSATWYPEHEMVVITQQVKQTQAAPEGLTGQAPTAASRTDGRIVGLDPEKRYEYRAEEDETYTAVASGAEEITGLAAGTYLVRLAGSDELWPSSDVSVTVPPYKGQGGSSSGGSSRPGQSSGSGDETTVVSTVFTDVPSDHWAKTAVGYVTGKGYFNGTSATTFSPSTPMTRSMLATVLWRMAGQPAPAGAVPFTDVPAGQWYTDAVAWAAEQGIVVGIGNGLFDPNGNITREQLAVMLHRYDGGAAASGADLSRFSDAGSISSWAAEAMDWAVANGILAGDNTGRLNPGGAATRAEVAQMLYNYDN